MRPKSPLAIFRFNADYSVFGSSTFSVECRTQFSALSRVLPIPKGLDHSAQRWPDSERDYAGVATREGSNPERVAYQRLMKVIQLFQSCDYPVIAPWVARSAQPRADRFNPFGIGLNPRRPRTAFGIPPKTAKNQLPPKGAKGSKKTCRNEENQQKQTEKKILRSLRCLLLSNPQCGRPPLPAGP